MRNLLCLVAATLMLTACATTQEVGRQIVDYGKQAGSWIGQKIESLYSKEGKPSSVEPQADGGKVVEYKTRQTVPAKQGASGESGIGQGASNATTSTSDKNSIAPNTRVIPCTTRYRTDSTGTIRSWTIDGEGCKAVEVETPPQP